MLDRYDQDMLLGYIEGDLGAADRAAFEEQLRSDETLRKLVASLQADRQAMRELPQEQPPTQLVDDAVNQLERHLLLGSPDDQPALAMDTKAPRPRHMHIGKILAYSGIAAAVLLSATTVFVTLTDTSLLDRAQQLAPLAHAPIELQKDDAATDDVLSGDSLAMAEPSREDAGDAGLLDELIRERLATTANKTDASIARQRFAMGESSAARQVAQEASAATEALADAQDAQASQVKRDEAPRLLAAAKAAPVSAEASSQPPASPRLTVQASDPQGVAQDIRDWARAHGIVVLSAPADTAAEQSETDAQVQRSALTLTLRLPRDQVAALVEHLGGQPGRRAQLSLPAEPVQAVALAKASPQRSMPSATRLVERDNDTAAAGGAVGAAAAEGRAKQLARADAEEKEEASAAADVMQANERIALAEAAPQQPAISPTPLRMAAPAPAATQPAAAEALTYNANTPVTTEQAERPQRGITLADASVKPAEPAATETPVSPSDTLSLFDWGAVLRAQLPISPAQLAPAADDADEDANVASATLTLPVVIIADETEPSPEVPTTQPAQ